MAPNSNAVDANALALQDKSRQQLEQDILHYAQAIIKFKLQINTLVPVARLPSEVLAEIFVHCRNIIKTTPSTAPDRHHRHRSRPKPYAWLIITHVCHRWRQVALQFPCLWSVVTLVQQEDCVREMLVRAKKAPLIICSAPHTHPHKSILASVLQDKERLVAVDVRARRSDVRGLEDLTVGPVPLLESLDLKLQGCYENPGAEVKYVLLDYFSDCDLPRLRTLSLYGGLRVWPARLMKPTLTRLRLNCSEGSHGLMAVTASFVVHAVAALPLLEELDLGNILTYMHEADWTDMGVHTVALPQLRALRMLDSPLCCADLLRRLVVPVAAGVSLYFTGPLTHATFHRAQAALRAKLISNMQGPLRSLFLSQKTARSGALVHAWTDVLPVKDLCRYRTTSKTIRAPHISLEFINTPGQIDTTVLMQLLESLDASQVEACHLCVPFPTRLPRDPAPVHAILERLPALRELSTDAWAASCIHNLLVHRVDSPAGSALRGGRKLKEVCLPRLAVLQLANVTLRGPSSHAVLAQDTTPLGSLYAALAGRKKARAPPLDTLVVRRCAHFSADGVGVLEKLVGRVEWDGVDTSLEPGEDDSDGTAEWDSDSYDSDWYDSSEDDTVTDDE